MDLYNFGESSAAGASASEQADAGGDSSAGGSASGQKRPVRRDPEKRRQQNARAQARHREKLRQRLEGASQATAAAAATNTTNITTTTATTTQAQAHAQAQTHAHLQPHGHAQIPAHQSHHQSHHHHHHHHHQHHQAAHSIHATGSNVTSPHVASHQLPSQMSHVSPDSMLFEGMEHGWDQDFFGPIQHLLDVGGFPSAAEQSSPDAYSASSATRSPYERANSSESSHQALTRAATTHRAPDSSIDYNFVDCGCSELHVQFSLTKPNRYRELPQNTHSVRRPYVADPYMNSLRVDRICLVRATWANCAQLGYTHALICNVNSLSPLVQGTGSYATGVSPGSSNDAMPNIPSRLTLDLRPTPEQLTIPHHPVLDILPFPVFRTNLIRLQGSIDGAEMFDDLVQGLVCWGGIDTRGDSGGGESMGRASTGMPWDSRSWEARTWFLQKYWDLLGGEDGELVRQSRWWREIRGEDTNLWDHNY